MGVVLILGKSENNFFFEICKVEKAGIGEVVKNCWRREIFLIKKGWVVLDIEYWWKRVYWGDLIENLKKLIRRLLNSYRNLIIVR